MVFGMLDLSRTLGLITGASVMGPVYALSQPALPVPPVRDAGSGCGQYACDLRGGADSDFGHYQCCLHASPQNTGTVLTCRALRAYDHCDSDAVSYPHSKAALIGD